MLRLYQGRGSSCSWRVRIGLALKRIEFESVWVDFAQGDQNAPGYREVNPIGQVPTLEVDGQLVSQSVAILELLEELHPAPALLPTDPISRATTRMVVEVVNAGIQPLHNGGMNESMRRQLGASDEQIQGWKQHWLRARLGGLEKILTRAEGEGRYAMGNEVGLADVMLYPQLDKVRAHGVSLDPFPRLSGVEAGLRERPEFEGTRNPPE